MATRTSTVSQRRINSWKDQFFATFSRANKAVRDRARLLAEWRDVLGDNEALLTMLRSNERGFGLTKRKAANAMELLKAHDRYPRNELLWDALGGRVVRIARIEDASLRRRVVRAVVRESEYKGGYVSDSKLSGIIRSIDPNYYVDKPGERARRTQRVDAEIETLDSDLRALKRSMRAAIEELESQDIDARSLFTRRALRIIDRA